MAAATVCSEIRVAAEAVSKPNVRSGTKDSAVSATAVRTNVTCGRRALRAMTAAIPTPTREKTRVSCAKPSDRDARASRARSANETPAADAMAAITVVATEATDGGGDTVLPDRTPDGGRGRRGGGGRVGIWRWWSCRAPFPSAGHPV